MTELDRIKQPIVEELSRYAQLFRQCPDARRRLHAPGARLCAWSKREDDAPHLGATFGERTGGNRRTDLAAAVALELLHTSSLIHDDVVDESEERRGKASVRKVYDNKVAVLLGDYMLAQTLRQSALTGHIGIVDAVAGLGGTLAEGEILQLSHVEQESFSEETYFSIIHRKTGALFRGLRSTRGAFYAC